MTKANIVRRRVERTFLAIAVLVGLVVNVFTPHPAHAGVLTSVQSLFLGILDPMSATAAKWSLIIFWSIAFFEFFYTVVQCVLSEGALASVLNRLVLTIIALMVGLWIVSNQIVIGTWATSEIQTIANAFSGAPLTPDDLLHQGFTNATAVANIETASWNPVVVAGVILIQFLTGFLIQIAYIVLAVDLLAVTIGVQLCIAVSSVLLGFIGTRWTRWIAAIYPRMLVTTILLLVMLNALAGIGTLFSAEIQQRVLNIGANGENGAIAGMATIAALGFVFLYLTVRLTSMVQSLGSSVPMSAGVAMVSAASYIGARAGSAMARGGSGGGAGASSDNTRIAAATRTSTS